MGPRYQYMNTYNRPPPNPQSPTYPMTGMNELFAARGAYASFGGTRTSNPMALTDGLIGTTFSSPQSPLANQPGLGNEVQQATAQPIQQTAPQDTQSRLAANGFDPSGLWDPGDLGQYDFDPTSFNFANNYGALEFGMLGHMSSAAGGASPPPEISTFNAANTFGTMQPLSALGSDDPNQTHRPNTGTVPHHANGHHAALETMPALNPSGSRMANNMYSMTPPYSFMTDFPRAFSVGMNSAAATPTSGQSPEQSAHALEQNDPKQVQRPASSSAAQPALKTNGGTNRGLEEGSSLNTAGSRQPSSRRRRGEPSAVYTSVTTPYSYTTGFHSLFALLSRRYAPANVLRIAKALASIRPSFISCTKTLNREDLIFMEKCFQRTLFEYEDFINTSGTPTLICRRTGEIAAVGKEFCILTKWRRDVLLGREANLNVNTGASAGGSTAATSSSSRVGITTPRVPEGIIDDSHIHPVSLAEIMDQASVVAFYEDFARLAFGDSHGVITTRYKLLKYQTKDEQQRAQAAQGKDGVGAAPSPQKRKRTADGRGETANEAGIDDIGADGKVECSCCWTVKRDLFDLPMMIVMNVSLAARAFSTVANLNGSFSRVYRGGWRRAARGCWLDREQKPVLETCSWRFGVVR